MSVNNKVISKIQEDILRFKENGYTEKKVRQFINKSYIEKQLDESEEFCFVGNREETIKEILQQADQIINQEYYSEYNSNAYYAPKIESVNVDTKYKVKQVGKVNEISFDDPNKIQGKDIETTYSTGGRFCKLKQKFIKGSSKLIITCEENSNNEPNNEE